MPRDYPTPLHEVLLCPLSSGNRHGAVIVIRRGRRCTLLRSITGQQALVASSELGLAVLEQTLGLPARVLEPEPAQLLALATLVAERSGTPGYDLGNPLPHLP